MHEYVLAPVFIHIVCTKTIRKTKERYSIADVILKLLLDYSRYWSDYSIVDVILIITRLRAIFLILVLEKAKEQSYD